MDRRRLLGALAAAPAALALYGPIDTAPTLAELQERRAA